MNRICNSCNIEIEENNYLKDRTVFKNCYNKEKRKNNNNNTLIQNQQPKSDDKKEGKVVDSVNKRTLIIGLSKCGQTYLIIHFLLQKQEPFFIITKSLNQYPNIKAQTSYEIQPLNQYENSTVVFDDKLLSKQESNIHLFFTRRRHDNIDIYHITQSYFHIPKKYS